MANVTAYIEYSLLNHEGAGYQPYNQIQSMGMTFEGGVAVLNGRYLGYLHGDKALVEKTIEALRSWNAVELTLSEAKFFLEQVYPTNTAATIEGVVKFIGPPTTDAEGKLHRPLLDTASGVPATFVERRAVKLYLADDFLGGNTTSGSVGSLGWTTQSGLNSTATAPVGRVGIITRATGNTANTVAGMALSSTGLNIADTFSMVWMVRLVQIDTNTIVRLGFSDGGAGTVLPTNGIYFERLGADANWFGVTRTASLQTRINTTIAVSTNFVKLYLRRIDSSTIGFRVNSGDEVTLNTTVPATALSPWMMITNTANGSKSIELDYFDLTISGLSR